MRYLPHTDADIAQMLAAIGAPSLDALLTQVTRGFPRSKPIDIAQLAEPDLLRFYDSLAPSSPGISFVGAGLYRHHIPVAVDGLISRGEFFTAYTPYQPEMAQGTLQAVFEFQSLVARLFGMEVANASMYDGASATAEGVLMCLRLAKRHDGRVVLSQGLHPDYIEVVRTYLSAQETELHLVELDSETGQTLGEAGDDVRCIVVQSPNCLGVIEDLAAWVDAAHRVGARLVVVVNNVAALGALRAPGDLGADIVVGEGAGIGVPIGFGGPGVGLFAARKADVRQVPGRLAGMAKDATGRLGYVLTLATREQHIRRERATSNICTNNGLCALAFLLHGVLLGPTGFGALATQCVSRARYLENRLREQGIRRAYSGAYFNELVLPLGERLPAVLALGRERGVEAGLDLGRWSDAWEGMLLTCVSDVHPRSALDALVEIITCA